MPKGEAPGPGRSIVGRARELDELRQALFDAPAPGGPVRLITGPPGIGKTRLAQELASAAEAAGVRTAWGHCWDDAGAPPFWPWTQLVRELRGLHGGADLTRVTLDEPAGRFELFDAVTDLVCRTAQDQRLLLVIDDLHDADAASLLLTRFVARHASTSRVLVVATMRTSERQDRPAPVRNERTAHIGELRRWGDELVLGGLDVDATAQLVGDPTHAVDVHAVTGGNPLHIQQVVQAASTDGRPAGVSARAGLRSAVHARVEALAPDVRPVLEAAAVVGVRHADEEVAAVLGVGPPGSALLAPGVLAGLLRPAGEGHHEFVHALVAEVVLAATEPGRRAALHQAAADRMADEPARIGERAWHLLRAGPDRLADAVTASWEAARAAVRSHAHEDVVVHVEVALEAIGADERFARERLDLLLLLGDSRWRSGHVREADDAFEAAWGVAVALGDGGSLARAALRNGVEYYFGADPTSPWDERISVALAAQSGPDTPWRARLLAQLATERLGTNDMDGLRRLATEALAVARRTGDAAAIGAALVAEQVTDLGPDTVDRRVITAREILACAEEAGDHRLALHGRFLLMGALLEKGEIRAMDAELLAQRDTLEELGEPRFSRFVLWFRCMRALLDGNPGTAEELAEQCLQISVGIGDPDAVPVYGGQVGVARWMQGRLAELEPIFAAMRAEQPHDPLWPAALAWLWASEGQTDAARGMLAELPPLEQVPRSLNWLVTMTAAADAAASVGSDDQVAALRQQLAPYAEHVVPIGMGAAAWGTVARPLGRLALRLGQIDEGLDHLTTAVRACARLGARPWLIEAQLELAEALAVHRPADPRIPSLVGEAGDAARQLGLDAFRARSERISLLASAPEAAPSSERRPRVDVLGTFAARSADGTHARWSSRKARELLKILVARRGAPVSREVLMDLLWPEQDPARLGNRLSVALSTVRGALVPGRRPRDADPIAADRDSVRLRLDLVDVDVERFFAAARQVQADHHLGEDVTELAHRTITSYRAEAFPDEPHADWAAPLRDEVRHTYLVLARLVAAGATQAGEHLRAAEAHRRVLELDPWDEVAHLGLVAALRAEGAHGQADAAHAAYMERMAELGIPPRD